MKYIQLYMITLFKQIKRSIKSNALAYITFMNFKLCII